MRYASPFLLLGIILVFSSSLHSSPLNLGSARSEMVYGVTIDNDNDVLETTNAIRSLSRRVCTRIVFDENVSALDYFAATSAIKDVSCVMGLVADSSTLRSYTLENYAARFREYFDVLSKNVDIWEIGNEVNGSWTGSSTDVSRKVNTAFDIAKQRGVKTALTLYFNTPCVYGSDREMFRWSEGNLSHRIRTGVDYLLISYYEDDCPGPAQDWNQVFHRLAKMFPNSKVGFGEIGTADPRRKKSLIKYYYELSKPGVITEPRFMGGYFYWYFHQDMVPKTKELWSYFNDILEQLP